MEEISVGYVVQLSKDNYLSLYATVHHANVRKTENINREEQWMKERVTNITTSNWTFKIKIHFIGSCLTKLNSLWSTEISSLFKDEKTMHSGQGKIHSKNRDLSTFFRFLFHFSILPQLLKSTIFLHSLPLHHLSSSVSIWF